MIKTICEIELIYISPVGLILLIVFIVTIIIRFNYPFFKRNFIRLKNKFKRKSNTDGELLYNVVVGNTGNELFDSETTDKKDEISIIRNKAKDEKVELLKIMEQHKNLIAIKRQLIKEEYDSMHKFNEYYYPELIKNIKKIKLATSIEKLYAMDHYIRNEFKKLIKVGVLDPDLVEGVKYGLNNIITSYSNDFNDAILILASKCFLKYKLKYYDLVHFAPKQKQTQLFLMDLDNLHEMAYMDADNYSHTIETLNNYKALAKEISSDMIEIIFKKRDI